MAFNFPDDAGNLIHCTESLVNTRELYKAWGRLRGSHTRWGMILANRIDYSYISHAFDKQYQHVLLASTRHYRCVYSRRVGEF